MICRGTALTRPAPRCLRVAGERRPRRRARGAHRHRRTGDACRAPPATGDGRHGPCRSSPPRGAAPCAGARAGRGRHAARTIAAVPSVEPSSMTRISTATPRLAQRRVEGRADVGLPRCAPGSGSRPGRRRRGSAAAAWRRRIAQVHERERRGEQAASREEEQAERRHGTRPLVRGIEAGARARREVSRRQAS